MIKKMLIVFSFLFVLLIFPNVMTYAGARAANHNGIGPEMPLPAPIDTPPTLTTQAVSNIWFITATGNGNITSLGAPNPTQHGFCWNTAGNPTTADSKTTRGAANSTGSFSDAVIGLSANTNYFLRAYATNTAGTANENEVAFNTSMFAVSGKVTDGVNPIRGVTITFSHDAHTETTDALGGYL